MSERSIKLLLVMLFIVIPYLIAGAMGGLQGGPPKFARPPIGSASLAVRR